MVFDVWLEFIAERSGRGYVAYEDFLRFAHKDSLSFVEFLEILRFLIRHIDSLDLDFCFEIGYEGKVERICGSHTLDRDKTVGFIKNPYAICRIHNLDREPEYFKPAKLRARLIKVRSAGRHH